MEKPTELEVKWAARTMFEVSNTTYTQKEIDVFWTNPHGNSRFIKAIVAKAQPQTGGGNGNSYEKAVNILIAYGIDCYRQPRAF